MDVHGISESSPSVNDFNILWTGVHPKPFVLRNLFDYQRVNHFPRWVATPFCSGCCFVCRTLRVCADSSGELGFRDAAEQV